jgi:hypothetical protein
LVLSIIAEILIFGERHAYRKIPQRTPVHICEMPRCRAVLSGVHKLADGDLTAWLG